MHQAAEVRTGTLRVHLIRRSGDGVLFLIAVYDLELGKGKPPATPLGGVAARDACLGGLVFGKPALSGNLWLKPLCLGGYRG